ncbi:transcription repressor NadR [Fusibacter sp. JL216-2]|uniref:transcription repressor NadR n=1 Tax=Fusibacter sp. JL216-2 TaxID=3071453 RepID=UPI003D35818A
MTQSRRDAIKELLHTSSEPVTGSCLAKTYDVSRQVIVQDVAVLRASGLNIIAASNGYFIPRESSKGRLIKTVVCQHDSSRLAEELSIMLDYGCKVLNVIVDHPVYGEIIGQLMISTPTELRDFLKKVDAEDAQPLSRLTDGEHIHTIEVPSEKIFKALVRDLRDSNFIID